MPPLKTTKCSLLGAREPREPPEGPRGDRESLPHPRPALPQPGAAPAPHLPRRTVLPQDLADGFAREGAWRSRRASGSPRPGLHFSPLLRSPPASVTPTSRGEGTLPDSPGGVSALWLGSAPPPSTSPPKAPHQGQSELGVTADLAQASPALTVGHGGHGGLRPRGVAGVRGPDGVAAVAV